MPESYPSLTCPENSQGNRTARYSSIAMVSIGAAVLNPTQAPSKYSTGHIPMGKVWNTGSPTSHRQN